MHWTRQINITELNKHQQVAAKVQPGQNTVLVYITHSDGLHISQPGLAHEVINAQEKVPYAPKIAGPYTQTSK